MELCKCSPAVIPRHLRGSRQTRTDRLFASKTAAGARMELSGVRIQGRASHHQTSSHLAPTTGSTTSLHVTARPTLTRILVTIASSASWVSLATLAAIGCAPTPPIARTVASACTLPHVSSVAAFWIPIVACAAQRAVVHAVLQMGRDQVCGTTPHQKTSRACPVDLPKSAVWR